MVHRRLRQRSAALFGVSIRQARETAKMSIEDASKALNIPATLLKGLESGAKEPTFETIFRLAETYKVKPPSFFTWSEPQTERECLRLIARNLDGCSLVQLRTFYRILLELRIAG